MSYAPMTPALWRQVKHFSPDATIDNWGDPYKMDVNLVFGLMEMRIYTGRAILVHYGCEKRPSGYHPPGMAVDINIVGLHVVDQFIVAGRFEVFNGIGVYPWWNSQGLHLDTRPIKDRFQPEARWASPSKGIYVPLDWDFLNELK